MDTMIREFKLTDCEPASSWDGLRLSTLKTELVYNPPKWMERGLQETSSGYGKRLNSGYSIRFEGRLRRIYVTIFSNSGTCWFRYKGKLILVDAY